MKLKKNYEKFMKKEKNLFLNQIEINWPTFCQVMRGTGVPTARAMKTTGSPSFTFVVVNRSTNFGATTCSFSITFKLHWNEVSPALFLATQVTTPASARLTFVIISELLPDSFTRILWVRSLATCWPFMYHVTSGYGRPVTRQSNLKLYVQFLISQCRKLFPRRG